MVTPEQLQQALALLHRFIDDAQHNARLADDMAQGDLYGALDPELRGHLAIGVQHMQMAQQMLEGATNG
jgi:hypothetical protein